MCVLLQFAAQCAGAAIGFGFGVGSGFSRNLNSFGARKLRRTDIFFFVYLGNECKYFISFSPAQYMCVCVCAI